MYNSGYYFRDASFGGSGSSPFLVAVVLDDKDAALFVGSDIGGLLVKAELLLMRTKI